MNHSTWNLTIPTLDASQNRSLGDAISEVTSNLTYRDRINIISILAYSTLVTGEGSPPFSDLELYAVTRVYDPTVAKRLEAKIGRRNPPVTVSVGQLDILQFTHWKSIQAYDIKAGGKVIYGNPDILDRVTLSAKEIPKYESIKILLNLAVAKLNGALSSEILKNAELEPGEKSRFAYNCAKAHISICRALLNFVGSYETSLALRDETFRKSYGTLFPSLHEDVPELARDISNATSMVLSSQYVEDNLLDYWFRAQRNVKAVLKFLLQEYFAANSDEMETILLLERFPHSLLDSLIYLLRVSARKLEFSSSLRSLLVEPWIKVHMASSFVLLAVQSDRTVDDRFVEYGYRKLAEVYPLEAMESESLSAWEQVRRTCVKLIEESLFPPPHMPGDIAAQ